jgi:hypothetical protein
VDDRRGHNTAEMIDLVFGRRLTFHTPLTPGDLTTRLEREVAQPRLLSSARGTQLFEGSVADGRFRMMRSVRGRNSFRPVISGAVSSGERGTRVDVRLQLHPVVMVFCGAVLLVGAMIGSIAIPEYLATGASPALIFMLGLAAVVTAFAIAAALEARKATLMLAALFGVEPVPPDRSRAPAQSDEPA